MSNFIISKNKVKFSVSYSGMDEQYVMFTGTKKGMNSTTYKFPRNSNLDFISKEKTDFKGMEVDVSELGLGLKNKGVKILSVYIDSNLKCQADNKKHTYLYKLLGKKGEVIVCPSCLKALRFPNEQFQKLVRFVNKIVRPLKSSHNPLKESSNSALLQPLQKNDGQI